MFAHNPDAAALDTVVSSTAAISAAIMIAHFAGDNAFSGGVHKVAAVESERSVRGKKGQHLARAKSMLASALGIEK